MSFQYERFANDFAKRQANTLLEKKDIHDLLRFDGYTVDIQAHDKAIILSKLFFTGQKQTDSTEFQFSKEFFLGTNLIVADNLRGKSSVFKVIKYALTGSNSTAKDVSKWLKKIYLEFRINDQLYTSFIDLTGSRPKGGLYRLSIDQLQSGNTPGETEIEFEVNNGTHFESRLQDFFFKNFEFYSLRWTQKSSAKSSTELSEASASWKTYFKSIYLESKDSQVLAYGSQEELTFQMLMGLDLTFQINGLKVKKDRFENDLGKENEILSRVKSNSTESLKVLTEKVDTLKKQRKQIEKEAKIDFNVEALYTKKNRLTQELFVLQQDKINANNELLVSHNHLQVLDGKSQNLVTEKARNIDAMNKDQKRLNEIVEYIEVGAFFSNLEIEQCPHCYTPVSQEKKLDKKAQHVCALCNNTPATPSNDIDDYVNKKLDLEKTIEAYELNIKKLSEAISKIDGQIEQARLSQNTLLLKTNAVTKENDIQKELSMLNTQISNAQKQSEKLAKVIDLERQIAVANYQIEELKNGDKAPSKRKISILNAKIEKLGDALSELKAIRAEQNQSLLNNLKVLMLQEITELGISGITAVNIDEAFKIMYLQNGNWVSFDDISEGEQLRVKIAFYLALIQLNSLHNTGKHPRLLMIDSPNKEEGDSIYIEGLNRLLQGISEKYQDKLQIIIGTATRSLTDSVPPERSKIYPPLEYMF